MRIFIMSLSLLGFFVANAQKFDIFQNDSVYAKNKISVRTMYQVWEDGKAEKKLVTYYNEQGKRLKQLWFEFDDTTTANRVETFHYSNSGLPSYIIDSFRYGKPEKTVFFYNQNVLKYEVTFKAGSDTERFVIYPAQNTWIQQRYEDGKAYAFDTAVFEKENVLIDYKHVDTSEDGGKWHTKYINYFDGGGKLVMAEQVSPALEHYDYAGQHTITQYFYDERNLLTRKQQVFYYNHKETMKETYTFVYL